jgi:uncharacterized protein (TIGR03118 family)
MHPFQRTREKSWVFLMSTLTLGLVPALQAADLGMSSGASPIFSPSLQLNTDNNTYQQRNLVSDGFVTADHTDPNLVNAWGITFNPNGVVWVADNGTGKSTLYDGNGVPQPLVVTIPGGKPTGIVFNGSPDDFQVPKNNPKNPSKNPSIFIFASEAGTISAWAPGMTTTVTVVDNSGSGAIYKGLALAGDGTGHFLYATDFHNGKIDVFDSTFKPVTSLPPGAFTDTDPELQGFAPFGIQNLNGDIYVTYAKQDAAQEDDVAGQGLGFVNVFDAQGNLIRRVASGGALNAPWGLAIAPAGFGKFSNRLLVGNFGDGRITAYDLATGLSLGQLRGKDGKLLEIDGLWGLSFGNGVQSQPTDVLFFTAGPNGEANGLYGKIEPTSSKQ